MSKYDTDYLIDQVKRRGSFPSSQNLFTNARLILMLDDELKTRIVPFLMSFHDNHFLTSTEYTGNGSTVSFKIPDDAVGGKLKDISIYYSNGEPKYNPVPRIDVQNLLYSNFGYYVEDNYAKFYPATKAPTSSDIIRMYYYKRVSDLVAVSEARQISNISGDDVDSATSLPSTFIAGAAVQIVSKKSPFKIVWTGEISSVVSNTITLDSTPTNAIVGDWLCLENQSVFPSIQVECVPLLCEAVVIKCMESMNDESGMQNAMNNYAQMEAYVKSTLSPKVDSSPKKIFAHNRLSRWL